MSHRFIHLRMEFRDAAAFVSAHHRHHTPPTGHLFSIGAYTDQGLRGVVIIGRPVARGRQDGFTCEITRLCADPSEPPVVDRRGKTHAPAVCSFLYGVAERAALALGYERIGTYTLQSESGASLRAAGWRVIAEVKGRSWDTPSRRRADKHPTADKLLWEPAA